MREYKSEVSSLDKVLNNIIDWAEIRGLLYGRGFNTDIQPEKQNVEACRRSR